MQNARKVAPSPEETERAERLREVLEALREANELVPVIVEGKRDMEGLRALGLEGEIIALHSGKPIYEFCEDILDSFDRVIVLMDWDRKGDLLQRELANNLARHYEEFSAFRELIRMLCQKDILHVEGIPKLLRRLEGGHSA